MVARVAVVGASGFVGRYVVRSLQNQGALVVATARDPSRLARFDASVEKIALDTAAPVGAYDLLGRPDTIVHLAWDGLPNYKSLHHIERELPVQYAFLRQAVLDGASDIVVAGTCLEYGLQSGEKSELDPPVPTTAYALAKHMLHRQLQLLQEQSPFGLSWCRLFYLYGEDQAPTSLWSSLHAAIRRNDASFNMSAGEQLRDFLPVQHAADLLAALALNHRDVGTINICSGRGKSVRALVEEWIAASGSQIRPNLGHYPYPDYEPLAFWGNADKLLRTLGQR
jgi:nucleoside-diphosphate-sugar epimerase